MADDQEDRTGQTDKEDPKDLEDPGSDEKMIEYDSNSEGRRNMARSKYSPAKHPGDGLSQTRKVEVSGSEEKGTSTLSPGQMARPEGDDQKEEGE